MQNKYVNLILNIDIFDIFLFKLFIEFISSYLLNLQVI